MNYGRAIRMARAARALSQQEVAARAGMTNSYLSLIEKGHRVPSIEKLEALAQALSVPLPVITLLAADEQDLQGIDHDTAAEMSELLLKLVIGNTTK